MDTTHLFRPIAAGDLKPGAKIVSYTPRGDGPELTLLEVLENDAPERLPGALLRPEHLVNITLRSPHGGDPFVLVLKAGTPIVMTGIAP